MGLFSTSSRNGTVERVARGARDVVDRAADQVAPAVNRVQDGVTQAADALQQGAAQVRQTAAQVRDLQQYGFETSRATVRAYPLTVVAAAVCLGLLLGKLTAR